MTAAGAGTRRVRKFRSAFLERISRSHPVLPFVVWLPVALALIFLGWRLSGSAVVVVGLVAAGWFSWTFAEYTLHRWVFHWEPSSERLNRLMRPIHKVHHEIVEWDRIVANPLFVMPLALAFYALFLLVLGMPAVLPFYGGFVLGYLTYELIHFRTHYARARTRWARALRRRHLQHHHACPARWFGVSTALWDYVFRTHVPRGTRPIELS